jgi:hypothetical protein
MHKDNLNHFTGVFLFCAGSAAYSIAFIILAGMTHKHLAQVHQGLGIFLFVSSGLLLLAFVGLWVWEENDGRHLKHAGESDDSFQTAYILEHCAYIVHLLFYMTFFLFHTPDPLKQPQLYGEFEGEQALDSQGVALRPLLRPVSGM